MRVATFNTLFPREEPDSWSRRRGLLRRAIERARPDVLGLQELLPSTLEDLPHMVGALSFIPGPDRGPATISLHPLIEPMMRRIRSTDSSPVRRAARIPKRISGEHLPIAYRADRLRPLESGAFWISPTPDQPASKLSFALSPFLVHWARFDRIGTHDTFLVLNAHLGHAPWHHGPTARIITERLRLLSLPPGSSGTAAPCSVFLIGDFNALPTSTLVRRLTSPAGAGLIRADRAASRQSGPPVTFHWGIGSRRLGLTIDYVLARTPLRAVASERIEVQEDNRYASDHHPLVVEFD